MGIAPGPIDWVHVTRSCRNRFQTPSPTRRPCQTNVIIYMVCISQNILSGGVGACRSCPSVSAAVV